MASSRNNVYGAMPRMNNGEREFGEYLDADTSGAVLWWHRKPWSVRVLLVDGRGFYPDFVVGIRHRPKVDHALLADTKYAFEMNKEMPKILAEHSGYGSVLILSKNPSKEWAIARMDAPNFRAVLGNRFRLADAPHY